MTLIRYFPQGIATDFNFCNRHLERQALKTSIQSHEHRVLVAPRRYGKTSLITEVLREIECPGECIDFFFVLNQQEVCHSIEQAVNKMINQMLPKAHGALDRMMGYLRGLNPKFGFQVLGQTLEIKVGQGSEKTLTELLILLDQCAQKTEKTCVLVMDEFQQIGELKENHAVEAAIRHAVERSHRVSYIFCGSKRHLLNEMFVDRGRPLYHLCDLMTIDRIQSSCYQVFLNELAVKKWGVPLADEVLDEILFYTENHPYYVNALCRRLWRQQTLPTIGQCVMHWQQFVSQQSPWIVSELMKLTLNRKKILSALAIESTKEPQSRAFSLRAQLNPSAIQKALVDLIRMDLVFQDQQGHYRLLDPAIGFFMRQKSKAIVTEEV